MLTLEFENEINAIMANVPKKRTNFLFSATSSDKVKHLMHTVLKNPVHIKIRHKVKTVDTLHQFCVFVPLKFKTTYLVWFLQKQDLNEASSVIIFAETKRTTMKSVFHHQLPLHLCLRLCVCACVVVFLHPFTFSPPQTQTQPLALLCMLPKQAAADSSQARPQSHMPAWKHDAREADWRPDPLQGPQGKVRSAGCNTNFSPALCPNSVAITLHSAFVLVAHRADPVVLLFLPACLAPVSVCVFVCTIAFRCQCDGVHQRGRAWSGHSQRRACDQLRPPKGV